MNKQLSELENRINYKFKDIQLLKTALTHSSYANENKALGLSNNERLEFLGDSVLNLTISNYIFHNYPNLTEGEMTKLRASVICELVLKNLADKLKIGDYLNLGKGEELTGGRKRPSILADAFEALVGAIYLDGGFQQAEGFILTHMKEIIENTVMGCGIIDYKTKLQELLQKNGQVKINYEIINEIGPAHNKEFISQVKCNGEILGIGKGKSKKEAEQFAAKQALESIVD